MSSLETRKIEPQSSTTVTLGEAGDTVAVPAGAIVKTNTVKDAGGNTLWTSDGAGTFSSVNSAIAGSMIFISSQTASAAASIEFTSGLDSTYDEYVFYCVNIRNASNDNEAFRFNLSTDGGSNYNVNKTSTYFDAKHGENGSGEALSYRTGHDRSRSTDYQSLCYECGNDADQSSCVVLHLFGPASTTYVKHFYATGQYSSYNDESRNSYVAGYGNTTSAINAIKFEYQVGTMTGPIYLYGIS